MLGLGLFLKILVDLAWLNNKDPSMRFEVSHSSSLRFLKNKILACNAVEPSKNQRDNSNFWSIKIIDQSYLGLFDLHSEFKPVEHACFSEFEYFHILVGTFSVPPLCLKGQASERPSDTGNQMEDGKLSR